MHVSRNVCTVYINSDLPCNLLKSNLSETNLLTHMLYALYTDSLKMNHRKERGPSESLGNIKWQRKASYDRTVLNIKA